MLRVENLTKNYGKFQALKGISFAVDEGRIFGFVGPNGAGKTTTLKIIATLQAPTSGKVWVAGKEVTANPAAVRRLIGYMPDFFGVYDNFKVEEYLDFYGACYGLSAAERRQVIGELLELVDLSHKRDSYVDTLSRGMKQRLCLARSLIHNPALLILDEPASGLDPRARIEMRELLKELKAMGKTILISSHILPELAELCTDIGIIENGQFVATGAVEEIMQRVCNQRVLQIKVLSETEKAMRLLQEQPHITGVTVIAEGEIQAGFNGEKAELHALLCLLIAQGIPVVAFGEVNNNLEDVFMRITKGVIG